MKKSLTNNNMIAKFSLRIYHYLRNIGGGWFWLAILGSMVATLLIYHLQNPWKTDFGPHASSVASQTINWKPIYFFYRLIVNILTGYSGDVIQTHKAIIVVLSICAGLKTAFSLYYAKFTFQKDDKEHLFLVICLTSIGFMALLPIFLPNWYIGKIFPNVWHNPSINFTIPFCITAFFSAVSYLENYSLKTLLLFGISCLIILLSKPSFFFCLAPVFPIFCLVRYGFQRPFWMAFGVMCIGGSILLWETFGLYGDSLSPSDKVNAVINTAEASSVETPQSGIEFSFLIFWLHHTDGIIGLAGSFLLSFLLPFFYFIFYFWSAISDLKFRFASALMTIALLIFSFISNIGKSRLHGNFSWQNIPASYLLHLVIMMGFLQILKSQNYHFRKRDIVFLGLYSLHLLSGIAYIIRLVLQGEYY